MPRTGRLGHGIAAIDWQWMLDFAAPYLER